MWVLGGGCHGKVESWKGRAVINGQSKNKNIKMDTAHFLSISAHSSILFCIFFNRVGNIIKIKSPFSYFQEDYVLASLPVSLEKDRILVADMDTLFVIGLSLSLFALLLETFFQLYLIQPPQLAFYALILHSIACLVLLKFTVDEHPVEDFWKVFCLLNCPPLIGQIYIFCVDNCCRKRKWKLC